MFFCLFYIYGSSIFTHKSLKDVDDWGVKISSFSSYKEFLCYAIYKDYFGKMGRALFYEMEVDGVATTFIIHSLQSKCRRKLRPSDVCK